MNMALKKNFAKAYANTAIESIVSEASPHKLVEILYENAIKNLKLAKIFIEQKNFEKKAFHLNKALSIITELRSGVDMERGKEVAENLVALYDYCYRTTFQASIKNEVGFIEEVISLLEPVAEAWQQMPDNIKRASKEQFDRVSL